MRFFSACKAFWVILFNRQRAELIIPVLEGKEPLLLEPPKISVTPEFSKLSAVCEKSEKSPKQSEAITLLASMQREARFLDFIQENIDVYDDAQVGAAARVVHDECAALFERFFAVQPLRKEDEMSQISIDTPDAACVQLVGSVTGQPPYRGRLTHHGWIATKCELPQWSGSEGSQLVVAPAEVELE